MYYYITIFFLVFLTIVGIDVRAHPPSDMTLEFDSNSDTLTVAITHVVGDKTSHFVESVVISVNGTVDQTHQYQNQTSLTTFVYIYTVVTEAGSTIRVVASCNQGGSITRTLGGTPGGGGIPGYMGLYLVLIVSVITMLTLIRRKLKKG